MRFARQYTVTPRFFPQAVCNFMVNRRRGGASDQRQRGTLFAYFSMSLLMKTFERRQPAPGRRLGTDRRWIVDLHYGGPERRSSFERRHGISRRVAY